jgi:hypothetical protein
MGFELELENEKDFVKVKKKYEGYSGWEEIKLMSSGENFEGKTKRPSCLNCNV